MELTIIGSLILVGIFLTMAKGKNSKMIVAFLAVVLLGMVVLNWTRIKPILMKG